MSLNLTSEQKNLIRWLVQQVEDGKLAQEFTVTWRTAGPPLIAGFGDDTSQITKGKLEGLADAQMISCVPEYADGSMVSIDWRCTLRQKAYDAVASDFSAVNIPWLTKQAPENVQMHVPEIVQAIEKWVPKQRYATEETYEAALAEYLVGLGIDAPEQQGRSLTDILAAQGIGVEVKLRPSRAKYDRLSGQIMRQLEEFGVVVVLILRPDKRDLLNEYSARFDDRVIFVIKG
jgi:hypothetical protein